MSRQKEEQQAIRESLSVYDLDEEDTALIEHVFEIPPQGLHRLGQKIEEDLETTELANS